MLYLRKFINYGMQNTWIDIRYLCTFYQSGLTWQAKTFSYDGFMFLKVKIWGKIWFMHDEYKNIEMIINSIAFKQKV